MTALLASALAVAIGHLLYAALPHIRRRPLWRAYLVSLGTLYAVYAVSYARVMWAGGYGVAEHMALTAWSGPLLLLHPFVMLVAMYRHTRGRLPWMP